MMKCLRISLLLIIFFVLLSFQNSILAQESGASFGIPSWSPTANVIAVPVESSGAFDIWIIDLDTFEHRNLSNSKNFNEQLPMWSPDGTKLAYLSNEGTDSLQKLGLWIMDASGESKVNLTQTLNGSIDRVYEWSVDGRFIAFGVFDESFTKESIWVIEIATLVLKQVSPNDGLYYFLPTWLADGRLAFISQSVVDGELLESNAIFILNDWQNSENFQTINLDYLVLELHASPSEDYLVAVGLATIKSDIFLISADGKFQENLTEFRITPNSSPRWSTDAKFIAFRTLPMGDFGSNVVIFDLATKEFEDVTKEYGDIEYERYMVWSSDSSQLIFEGTVDRVPQLYLLDMPSNEIECITCELKFSED